MRIFSFPRRGLAAVSIASTALLVGGAGALPGDCGPFTDVTTFCQEVLEIFTLGITTGATPTTYDPASNVSRLQMAIFLSRSVDRLLQRGSIRTALRQFWTPQNDAALKLTTIGGLPQHVESDGADLWATNYTGNSVSRVRGSDGMLLETWTGASSAEGVLVAAGYVYVTGNTSPGQLYQIDPSQSAGAVNTVATNLGNFPAGIAFDGSRIWTANNDIPGGISIVTPGAVPWTVTTVTAGFFLPIGALYDGANVWITIFSPPRLLKLDSAGAILQSVTVGNNPQYPVFDGTNIWVPNGGSGSVSVVRASSGEVLATLTGNGLISPVTAAFDGQRVLVTNNSSSNVSLWKAADLTTLGSFGTGTSTHPYGACSDGARFWIALASANKLARF
ncbi:MAG TPA: hypothetical protein VKG01_20310 [Thermoanaerobaculia bacterium]|nr:hypothetical protein [Thermoanaerobaculia bacterium]